MKPCDACIHFDARAYEPLCRMNPPDRQTYRSYSRYAMDAMSPKMRDEFNVGRIPIHVALAWCKGRYFCREVMV